MKVQGRLKKTLILSMLGVAVALILTTMIPIPPKPIVVKEHQGVLIAHGQILDPVSGCAACHTQPIVAACADCHPSPPTTVNNISFPHHDPAAGGPPDNCQSGSCHDGTTGDARFVVVLDASHTYCSTCHDLTHSSP